MPPEDEQVTNLPELIYCPNCGYDLRGQAELRCPECNFYYDVEAVRDLRNKAASRILCFYFDAIPFLVGAVGLALAGLAGQRLVLWPVLLFWCTCMPFIKGWILSDIKHELNAGSDVLPWWVPDWMGLLRIRLLLFGYALLFSLLSPTFAMWLAGAALFIGVVWTVLAMLNQSNLESTHQDLSLNAIERSALKRARVVSALATLFGIMLWLSL